MSAAGLPWPTCRGCTYLEFEDWPNGARVAICTDGDKPVLGRRRVVEYSRLGVITSFPVPRWCRFRGIYTISAAGGGAPKTLEDERDRGLT